MSQDQTLFLRKASGLVRSWKTFDGFIYALYGDSVIVAGALTYGLSYQWSAGNIPLAILLITLAVIPVSIVYAMLASTIPRVGGDYVWQSRTFGGIFGYTLCLSGIVLWPMLYAATNWYAGGVTVAAPLFLILGGTMHIQSFINLATWLGTADGLWWGFVFNCVWALFILIAGMKWYGRIQRWSFYIGCVAVVAWVGMFLVTTNQDFVSNFNWFMTSFFQWGGSNPYQYVLNQASAAGYNAVPLNQTTLGDTYALMPVMAYVFIWVTWAGAMSGEISGIDDLKKSMRMYVGAALFALLLGAGTMYLTLLVVGNQFFFSANYLWYSGTASMPIAPFIGFLYLAMTRNPIMWAITIIGFNAWFWIWDTNNWVNAIRISFAMSFDRSLPDWVGSVNKKFRVPLNAILIITAGSLIMGYLYYYTVFASYTLDVVVGTAAAIVGSTVAGTFMPYMKSTKAMWEASPASKYKVGPVPVITICGILGIVFLWIPLYYLWIVDPRYGVNSPLSGAVLIGSFVGAAIIFLIMKAYRKRQGIDLNLVYREIPYE